MQSLVVPRQISSAVQLQAAERRRAGVEGERHGIRDGEVRRRMVRRLQSEDRLLRYLPGQLRGEIVRKADGPGLEYRAACQDPG